LKLGDEFQLDRFHFVVSDFERGFVHWFKVTVGPEIVHDEDDDSDDE